ncbi:Transglutaminase-like superfamily protein [Pseudoalteromonas sp. THAF3]|nr:Transglutaminase-like superfamily protein [Pseudoalteromonas sp. THAF3]
MSSTKITNKIRWLGLGLVLAMLLLMNAIHVGAAMDSGLFQTLMRNQYGTQRLLVAQRWQQLLASLSAQPETRKVQLVNQFFATQVRYRTDQLLYKQQDYWATPLETLGQGLGDCEDYAIAKYASLRMLGIADNKLRLIYVKAQIGGPRSQKFQAHMVLGYYSTPSSQPIILDSLTSAILPAAKRTDLYPVFSFNSEGLWTATSTHSVADPRARLSRWHSVLKKMEQQGVRW